MIKILGTERDYKNSLFAIMTRSLSLVLLIVSLFIFLPLIYHFSVAIQPTNQFARDGVINIQTADISAKKTVSINGDWHFYWQQLLSPEDIKNHNNKPVLLAGSGGWQSTEVSNIGIATYHLEVALEQNSSNLALHIPQIESAYKLYINSDLMAAGGVVDSKATKAKAGYNSNIVNIPNGLKTFDITIQVSNFHSSWGGLWNPVILGEQYTLHSMHRDKVALSMFIFGTLLISIIHSLIQYILRPKDKIPLVFACLCLMLFLREFTVEHMNFALVAIPNNFAVITRLNFFSFYAGIPIALFFFQLCYPKDFHSRFCLFIYILSAAFVTFALAFPTRHIGLSVLSFQIIALCVMVYIVYRIWLAMRNKRKGAGVMLAGSVIAFSFAANDILYLNNLLNTGKFFSLGIISFITCQSFVTNSRFVNFINKNTSLTEKLKQRNADLEIMSSLLETKVAQRTQQLQLANKELKALANTDPLTKAFNRHGLKQYIQGSFERYRRTQEPFSLLLVDYDLFKQINDNYGHGVGDQVLKNGADIIRANIREQDKLARWGGEEFLILLPNTHLKGALKIAEKLKASINAGPIEKQHNLMISITGGVAQVRPQDNFESLFSRADDNLYKGKQLGRNQVCG